MRFSLRTLLIVLTVLSVLMGAGVRWWVTPYVLFGTYPDGVRAWEQTMQRTLKGGAKRIKMVRYYRNGRKGFDYDAQTDTARYWSPTGAAISEEECWKFFIREGPSPELDPRSPQP